MNCDDEKSRELSKKQFLKANTIEEFLELWAKFYSNEICISTYLETFVGAEDNPQADRSMAEKFQKITSYGLIAYDFQTNSLADGQKGYVLMFAPQGIANHLTTYINRYPGYLAFSNQIEDKRAVDGIFVTYDPDEKLNLKTGVLFGSPYTQLGYAGKGELDEVKEWMNKRLKKLITEKNYRLVTVVDTLPSEKPDRILDMILIALTDIK